MSSHHYVLEKADSHLSISIPLLPCSPFAPLWKSPRQNFSALMCCDLCIYAAQSILIIIASRNVHLWTSGAQYKCLLEVMLNTFEDLMCLFNIFDGDVYNGIECHSANLMMTPNRMMQLICWRERMPLRGNWTGLRCRPGNPHEVLKCQVHDPAPGSQQFKVWIQARQKIDWELSCGDWLGGIGE